MKGPAAAVLMARLKNVRRETDSTASPLMERMLMWRSPVQKSESPNRRSFDFLRCASVAQDDRVFLRRNSESRHGYPIKVIHFPAAVAVSRVATSQSPPDKDGAPGTISTRRCL